eukprot:COSAG06_NODE_54528_length_294_cov_0.769231_1_plen_29_part_10
MGLAQRRSIAVVPLLPGAVFHTLLHWKRA